MRRPVLLLAAVTTAVAGSLIAVSPVADAKPPKPVISKVSAHSGSVAGGRKITITGRNFGSKTKVYFGTTRATRVKKVSSKKLWVVVPQRAGGLINIKVRAKNGTSKTVRADRFQYVVSPVSSLRVARTTTTAVQLRWANPASTRYGTLQVRRNGRAVANLRHGTSSYTGTRLLENTRYSFTVVAYYRSSSPSAARTTYGRTANVAPPAVTSLAASVSGSQITLSWRKPNATDLKSLKICRSAGTAVPLASCAAYRTLGSTATRFVDTNVSAGEFTYAVVPYDKTSLHGPVASVPAVVTGQSSTPAVIDPRSSDVTADTLPTVQIAGGAQNPAAAPAVAWCQVVVGNTVYVGGDFSRAIKLDGTTETRRNVLAFDLTTGDLITSFVDPDVNGAVRSIAASPDGTRIYIGGDFTQVGGEGHAHVAALDAQTGAVVSGFTAGVGGRTNEALALVATSSGVYVGGDFTTASGVKRSNLAYFTSSGALTTWAPVALGTVTSLLRVGSNIVIGGHIIKLNGQAAYGIAAVAATGTGVRSTWLTDQKVRNYGDDAAITSLSTDGTRVYGTAYDFTSPNQTGQPRNLEGMFAARPSDGQVLWIEDCHGDTYGSFSTGSTVYTATHAHDCATVGGFPDTNPRAFRRTMAFTADATGRLKATTDSGYRSYAGTASPSIIDWFPTLTAGGYSGQDQSTWAIAGNAQYVVEVGEFPKVNGVDQQGIARFANRSVVTDPKVGPQSTVSAFTPTATQTSTSITISIKKTWDADGLNLKYELLKRDTNNVSQVIQTVSDQPSTFWSLPTLTFAADTGLTPNTTYTYRVRATDADGNQLPGREIPVTTSP